MKTLNKRHVKVGDRVRIIAGNQKGIIGNISLINTKKQVVTVDTVLPRVKYLKNREGGDSQKIDLQIPIHISNVMLWDKEANVSDRIGYKLVENQKKRYFKKSGNFL